MIAPQSTLLWAICRLTLRHGRAVRSPFDARALVAARLLVERDGGYVPTRHGWAAYYAAEGVAS